MKILALSTSGATGSLALFDGPQLIGERLWTKDFQTNTSHSELFSPALNDLIKAHGVNLTQIGFIAVDIGPGSFTGIRVGVNAARTLAYSIGVPVIKFDSLTILAQQSLNQKSPFQEVLVALNAFRNFVYAAKFKIESGSLIMTSKPQAFVPKEFSSLIVNGVLFLGDAKEAFLKTVSDIDKKNIFFLDTPPSFSSARTLGQLALRAIENQETVSWKEVLPLYIRKSEAEEKLGGT